MKVRFLLPALGVLCCWGSVAHADLKWTEVMKFDGGQAGGDEDGPGQMTMTTNKWIKKEATRSETSFSVGPMQMTNADIMRCDTKETILLEPDLKMYAIVPATPGAPGMAAMPGMGSMPGAPKGKPGKGTSLTEVSVQDLGKETISQIDTQHYVLKMKNTATGCAGNGTTETTMEMWVADIRMPAPCQEVDYKTGIASAFEQDASCDITAEIKGDTALLQKVYSGFVMRMKMAGSKGAPGFIKEVTMLSQAELDDAPFTIPTDWKKVSEKQLQDAKQKAMMKKMMEGMANGGNMGDMDGGDEE